MKYTLLSFQKKEAIPSFVAALEAQDIRTFHFPSKEASFITPCEPLNEAIDALSVYSGVIFTNPSAAEAFFAHCKNQAIGAEDLPDVYCIGKDLGEFVCEIAVDQMEVFSVEAELDLLEVLGAVENQFFLHPVSEGEASNLGQYFQRRGGKVNSIIVCRDAEVPKNIIRNIDRMLVEGGIDCVAFFQPEDVTLFVNYFPEFKQATMLFASHGTKAALAVMGNGLRLDIVSDDPSEVVFAEVIAEHIHSDHGIDTGDDFIMDI